METTTTLVTTYPYEATSPGVARHQCEECGGWERSDKGPIRHSKRCESRPQAVPLTTETEAGKDELRKFASDVRTYSQTKGRDADTLSAVRAGYLSVNDAMNVDD
jgi:hypothetical protein